MNEATTAAMVHWDSENDSRTSPKAAFFGVKSDNHLERLSGGRVTAGGSVRKSLALGCPTDFPVAVQY